ncbi:MAG: TonB-dependent receptor [Erythrobacter sp.]|nr:TonB-dependent receptor [Erythrobacter sp.]
MTRTASTAARLLASAAALCSALPALAQDDTAQDGAAQEEQAQASDHDGGAIYVYGRGEQRIGSAGAASEGGVAGADIELRPLLRPGELLEATPGLIATQHSGGGKANQFFLRGFNLDHGTDFSLYIDDMPVNFRTHGHGQGYLDVNGLIPETVARVDYRKGPYRVDAGDFSFVGSSSVTTHDRLQPFVTLEAGAYGYRRAVGGGSVQLGGGDLLLVGQAKVNDGPWQLPEDFEGYSLFAKYSHPLGMGDLSLSYSFYDASWAPTEQLPDRVVGTAECPDRYCSLDPTLRGSGTRHVVTLGYASDDWRVTAYVQHYSWSLLNNFTFLLEDPVNGDQIRQFEQLWTLGGRVEHTAHLTEGLSLRTGAETRYDDISPIGLDHTVAGQFNYNTNSFAVSESSLGLYAEAVWQPVERLMVIGGLRGDWYHFRTRALGGLDVWSGSADDHVVSPKIGANYEVADGVALYANWGQGFHSNDARGVTNPASPAPGLVEGNFRELGARLERGGLILTGVYWWSAIDSELIYVGDSGAVEPSDPGRRHGYELTAFYRPTEWLAIDGVLTGTHSRFAGLPEGENFVPGALESSGELGVIAAFPEWNASVRLRYLGPHPLVEDNSVRGQATTLVNARLAWTPQRVQLLRGFEFHVELLNAFDSKRDDIDYYYETRLPGEPPEGVLGTNSRIVEPRQLRVGMTRRF